MMGAQPCLVLFLPLTLHLDFSGLELSQAGVEGWHGELEPVGAEQGRPSSEEQALPS